MKRAGRGASSRQKRASTTPLQLQLFPLANAPETEPMDVAPSTESPRQAMESVVSIVEPKPETASTRDLARRLGLLMPGRLGALTLTNNRSTIVSARDVGGRLAVRIQRCFASAPAETLAAVARFLTSGKHSRARRLALAEIREYFADHGPQMAPRRKRRLVLRPVGQTLDLREVRDEINRSYFENKIDVHITWGRAPTRRRGRRSFSVRLGTYSDRENLVRIHRCLDRADVPRYVVESVVHHEMLHAALPPVVHNGRRRIHTPEFRRRERQFAHHRRAEQWLERHLKRLI